MTQGRMETLSDAMARLERRGFRHSFRAVPEGTLEAGGESYDPRALLVEETVRFEGTSDPQDEVVLFALRSADDRVRGTFVANFGPQVDPNCAAVIQLLEPVEERQSDAVRVRHGRGGTK